MARKSRSAKAKRTGETDTPKAPPPKRGAHAARTVDAGRLRDFVRSQAKAFLKDPNITSIGVGYKSVRGVPTKQLSVQFTVRSKVGENQIEALGSAMIPKSLTVDGVEIPTDVLEREYHPTFEIVAPEGKDIRKQRLQTLVPGISVSHPSGTAGTLGLVVFDQRDGTACMLSNWHVLQTPMGQLGDMVVQPGPFDDNRVTQNRAGVLLRSHLGQAGDCAIARIDERGFDPAILELGVTAKRLARPNLGDQVVKSGRTTAVTYGVVHRVDVTSKIFYGGLAGEQLIGGFEIGPDPARPAKENEISTGGDSGSAWLVAGPDGKATDVLVGLHFAGEGKDDPDEHALACYAHAVFEKLEIALEAPAAVAPAVEALAVGYDERFLGPVVGMPAMSAELRQDAVTLQGSTHLHYTHFSLAISKARRMARFVAWNIDGGRLLKITRKGLDFVFDARIPQKFQVGNEAYVDNKLDRGHIARRADLVWGGKTEAGRANRDSFFFTNITPQHEAFNQSQRHGLWGELENAIFEDVDVDNLRVAVMGGPLFKDTDRTYRGVRIPSDFWKLLAFVDAADKQLKVKAYILTQDNLLDDIEALELDPFRLFQVSISELATRSSLGFGSLGAHDEFESGEMPEALSATGQRRPVREVHSRADLLG